ncbi:hypothetical protein CEXT_605171 [Caerostris extrusa]|uniref:Uncharacterized protein n=1 Tax=Caerostris extrusa TaxID=172846 RepID=A0AAV4QGG2_CAEEX|nr:hypothetical protein CEXT_605171 [Caerostris extrusa]
MDTEIPRGWIPWSKERRPTYRTACTQVHDWREVRQTDKGIEIYGAIGLLSSIKTHGKTRVLTIGFEEERCTNLPLHSKFILRFSEGRLSLETHAGVWCYTTISVRIKNVEKYQTAGSDGSPQSFYNSSNWIVHFTHFLCARASQSRAGRRKEAKKEKEKKKSYKIFCILRVLNFMYSMCIKLSVFYE